MQSVPLTCHPTTRCDAVRSIRVEVRTTTPKTLALRYVLEGDMARLGIPAESAPQRADKLWQHSCFEAFVGAMGAAGYYEFNFSPSTEWAAYRFDAYREGMAVLDEALSPRIAVRRDTHQLILEASIDLGPFRLLDDSHDVRLALCAVIEDIDHTLSYWALAHPPAKPDFHHAAGFAVTLPLTPTFSRKAAPSPRLSPARVGGDVKKGPRKPK